MLAVFCLRLAFGLALTLLVLSPAQVAPRFYRVQFLSILGLLANSAFLLGPTAPAALLTLLAIGMLCSFLGSVVWMLEGAPGGRPLIGLTALTLLALPLASAPDYPNLLPAAMAPSWYFVLDDVSSALVLGTATSAMLLGHAYLVAPGMSLTPLFRLLLALWLATLLRLAVAAFQFSYVTTGPLTADAHLWLPVRWLVGFLGPLILTGLAWQCARLRSTQSATGILYVVVILCFIGELVAQLIN